MGKASYRAFSYGLVADLEIMQTQGTRFASYTKGFVVYG